MSSSSSSSSAATSRKSSITSGQGLRFLVDRPRGAKPIYSYHSLVRAALLDSPNIPLTAAQVWDSVCVRFSFFKTERGMPCRFYIINTLSNTPCFLPYTDGPRQAELYWTYNPNLDIHLTNSTLPEESPNGSMITLVNAHYQWDKDSSSDSSSEEQQSESDVEEDSHLTKSKDMLAPGDLFEVLDLGMQMDALKPEEAPRQKPKKDTSSHDGGILSRWDRGRSQRQKKAAVTGIPLPEFIERRPSRGSSRQSHERLPFHSIPKHSPASPPSNPQSQARDARLLHQRRRATGPLSRPDTLRHQTRQPPSSFCHNNMMPLHPSSRDMAAVRARSNSSEIASEKVSQHRTYSSNDDRDRETLASIGEDVNPEVEKRKRREMVHGYGPGFGYEQRVEDNDNVKERYSLRRLKAMKIFGKNKKKDSGCCIIG